MYWQVLAPSESFTFRALKSQILGMYTRYASNFKPVFSNIFVNFFDKQLLKKYEPEPAPAKKKVQLRLCKQG